MNLIGLKDLRQNIDKYTKLINKKGESFLVIRKGKPIFRLSPVEEEQWEMMIDFTEFDPKGVPIEKVIAALAENTK